MAPSGAGENPLRLDQQLLAHVIPEKLMNMKNMARTSKNTGT
jgi:hypothetical protein